MMDWIRNEPLVLVLLAGLAVVVWSSCSLWRSAGTEDLSGPGLAEVLSGVKEELRLARQHSDLQALPSLSKVEVELEVMISESTEGAVSASVVPLEASGKVTRSRSESTTQKVKVALQPPQKSLVQEVEGLEGHPLARAIVQVAEDLAKSAKTAPRLDVVSVEFNVKFVVTSSHVAEGGFDLKVLGASNNRTDSGQASHNVKLVFAPPKEGEAQGWEE